jgi:hypothetical protein
MKDSRLPGFTADASLYRTSQRYRIPEAPSPAGAIQPQMPADFIGEWMARADSVAAFYGGGSFHASSLADIAERRMCLALARSCRNRNMAACHGMMDECPHH